MEGRRPSYHTIWYNGGKPYANSGVITLTQPLSSFDVIIIEAGCDQQHGIDLGHHWYWRERIRFHSGTNYNDNQNNDYAICTHPNGNGIQTIYWLNDTQMYVGGYTETGALYAVYGIRFS